MNDLAMMQGGHQPKCGAVEATNLHRRLPELGYDAAAADAGFPSKHQLRPETRFLEDSSPG